MIYICYNFGGFFVLFLVFVAELTNMIILRNSSMTEMPSSPMLQRHKPSHMQFHMIKHEDITWVQLNSFKKSFNILLLMLKSSPLL